MAVLSNVAEGCAEAMKKKLKSILPHVLRCLQDPDVQVSA